MSRADNAQMRALVSLVAQNMRAAALCQGLEGKDWFARVVAEWPDKVDDRQKDWWMRQAEGIVMLVMDRVMAGPVDHRMASGTKMASFDNPDHAALMEAIQGQLCIAFLHRLGDRLTMHTAELDRTGGYNLLLGLSGDGILTFELQKKQ